MAAIILPDVGGITARHWVGDDDYVPATFLVNTEMSSVGIEAKLTVDDVQVAFENTANLDLSSDFLFTEVDGVPVAYVITRWWEEAGGPHVYRHMCKVLPEWRGRGIGTAMLDWAQAHLREIAAGHDAIEKVFRTDVDNIHPPTEELLESFGYKATQHTAELMRPDLDDIPDAALPDGVEIRPVEEGHLRRIFNADWEAAKDHWGYYEPTDDDWNWFLEFPHSDESLWKIAWVGDKVVGQVRGFINTAENAEFDRRRGWSEFISTAREYRRGGIATALICETLREFKLRGMDEAALGVHVENPNQALRLYQNLGFEPVTQGATYECPLG